jgi:hypothetical protein
MQGQLPAREARVGESWSSGQSSPLVAPKITVNRGQGVKAAAAGGRREDNNRVSFDSNISSASNCLSEASMDLMEGASDSRLEEGQTWLVMEYCNKGCLQVGMDA